MEDTTDILKTSNSHHYCYILRNSDSQHFNRTYNGYTVNPTRRIRQHNQEIKGGAKYTRMWGNKNWEIYAILKGFPDRKCALQCEWRIKHPVKCKTRPRIYNSPEGRILGLNEILKMEQWTTKSVSKTSDLNLELWIVKDFSHCLTDLPPNITVHIVDEIDLTQI